MLSDGRVRRVLALVRDQVKKKDVQRIKQT
jgi:hypothetical protein